MQSEISFLLDLILDEELSSKVQKLCRKRVRELELGIGQKSTPIIPQRPSIPGIPLQAPSAQKKLNEMAAEGIAFPGVSNAPQIPTTQRIVGGEVNTGGGTKGPRKW